MANEIKIKVTTDNDLRSLEEVKLRVKETGEEVKKLGDNFTETDRISSKFGEGLRHAKKTKVTDLLDDVPDPSFISGLSSKLGSALSGAPPLAIAGGLIGAALAPSIAAGIAAGITGGIGIGFIGAGVALIAKDPIIKDNAARIGKTFKDTITTSARGAFLGPVTDSLGKLEQLASRSAPKIGQAFTAVAPSVKDLTGNVTRLADSFLDDLTYAAGKSGPAVAALGDLIEHTGISIGDMIHTLSNDAPQGASAINDLDGSMQNLIRTVTGVIDGLAKVKGASDSVDNGIDGARNSIEDFFTAASGGRAVFDITADGYTHGSEAAKLYSKGVIGAKGALNDYEHYLHPAADATNTLSESMTNAQKAADGERGALNALSAELKAETDPVFGLLDAQDKLADSQRAYTKAVKKGGEGSEDAQKALRDLAKASIDLEGRAGALGDTFNGEMTPALRNTLKTAGLTSPEIARIAAEFRKAKKDGDSFARTYAATAKLTTIYKTIRETQNTNYAGNSITGGRATGGIVGAAASGSTGSGLTWVGEQGPELADLPAGTRVWSAGDSKRMASGGGSGGGGGGGDVRIYLDPSGGNEVASALFQMIRAEVRGQYGGIVQRAFGQIGAA